ncbi:hypothetical protein BsWGS_14717 [Bradybaena similaris]
MTQSLPFPDLPHLANSRVENEREKKSVQIVIPNELGLFGKGGIRDRKLKTSQVVHIEYNRKLEKMTLCRVNSFNSGAVVSADQAEDISYVYKCHYLALCRRADAQVQLDL